MRIFKNEVGRPTNRKILLRNLLKNLGLLIVVGIIIGIGYYLNDYKKSNNTAKDSDDNSVINSEDRYATLSKEYEIKYEPEDYLNGYFVAVNNIYINGLAQRSGDIKYGIIDINGNVKVDFKYDIISVENNYFSLYDDEIMQVLDKNLNHINYEFADVGSPCNKKYCIIKKNDKYGLIDDNNNVVTNPIYDQIETDHEENYFIATKDNKNYVFDKNANLILSNVIVNKVKYYNEGEESFYYDANKYFIVIKVNKKYKVYSTKSKTYSNEYDYVSLGYKYYGYNNNGKTYTNDSNHKLVSKFNGKYNNYEMINKNIIAIESKVCDSEEYTQYYDLYNNKGKSVMKCSTFAIEEDTVYVKGRNNIMHVYKGDNELLKVKTSEHGYIYSNGYGNFETNASHRKSNKIYTSKGKQLLSNYKLVVQVSDNLYVCSNSSKKKYLLDVNGNKILKKSYQSIRFKSNRIIVVKNDAGKYGVVDIDGNVILDEKYDDIELEKNYIKVTINDKKYIKLIEYVNKEEYDEYLKNDNNINF